MSLLQSFLAMALFVSLVDCIGETKRRADAPAPAPATSSRPAVGGGPRDPYPDCSAAFSPVPADRSSLPASSPDAPLDPCLPKTLPPIDGPRPPETK